MAAPGGLSPSLEGSYVDLAGMRADALRLLVDALSAGAGGSVTLVLDAALSGPLALLTSTSVLREHGVERIHHLGPELGGSASTDRIVYIARDSPANAAAIAEHVRFVAGGQGARVDFGCFLVPRVSLACEQVFEERGVMGDLEVEGLVVFVLVCDVEWRWKKTGRTERKKKKKNKAVS